MQYAFVMRKDEATAKEILKWFDYLIDNLERTEQRGEQIGTARLGAMYAAMEATLRVVSAEYDSMRGMDMLVQWASVYANMMNTGKLPPRNLHTNHIVTINPLFYKELFCQRIYNSSSLSPRNHSRYSHRHSVKPR